MIDAMTTYLRRYFISNEELEARSGLTRAQREAFERAGCAPGAIYKTWPNGAVWSVLSNAMLAGHADGAVQEWRSPASVWWLRLANALDATAEEAAADLERRFAAAFEHALRSTADAQIGFPELFNGDALLPARARREAATQWRGWIDGGYAVCLRRFSADAVVTKIAARAKIKALAATERAPRARIIEEMARLEAVLLPFSPFERTAGTPGWAIDDVLAQMTTCGREPWASAA